MTSAGKSGVYALREHKSAQARQIIDDVCRKQGETFHLDPYFQSIYKDPVGLKVSWYLNEGGWYLYYYYYYY